jgi:hypothetical protein
MGVRLTYGTAGATGGGWSVQPGSLQPTFEESWHEPKWNYQRRAPKCWKDKNQWVSLWSFGCRLSDPNMEALIPISRCMVCPDNFEPYSRDGEGTQTKNAIRGTTKDSVGATVANAIVQGFVTVTDAFVGEVTSGNDGTYTLMTEQLKTTQHYLVAYKAGSPDIAGTTVNTLLPTNVDGS